MQKYTNKDNQIAVLYSPGYGAGWYTENTRRPDCLFHPELVELVMKKEELDDNFDGVNMTNEAFYGECRKITAQVVAKAKELFGEEFCTYGADQLSIEWMVPGQCFRMRECDGSESIEYAEGEWLTA